MDPRPPSSVSPGSPPTGPFAPAPGAVPTSAGHPTAPHGAVSIPDTTHVWGQSPWVDPEVWGRPDPGAPPQRTTEPAARPPRPARGWVAGVALAAVAGLALGGAGLAVGQSLAEDPPRAAATSTVSGGATTPTLEGLDAEEPVAAVAQALGPAVVQIENGEGLGSGFVYDTSGLIMTAAHVVGESREVQVVLADGRRLAGSVVGADPTTDIAVVEVEGDDLTAAPLALDDPAQVGQLAVAIGSPFGLDQTVTAGIVSAVGRTVETPGGVAAMIQTDTPINPGNSGGALADRQGRIIGVNVSIASGSGGNVGVGFAVPIDTAKDIADRLVAGETITNGILGVSAADAAGEVRGALVQQVTPSSPAADAGVAVGDVVVAVDGDPVTSAADLVAAIRSREPGAEVALQIDRRGERVEIVARLTEAPQS